MPPLGKSPPAEPQTELHVVRTGGAAAPPLVAGGAFLVAHLAGGAGLAGGAVSAGGTIMDGAIPAGGAGWVDSVCAGAGLVG